MFTKKSFIPFIFSISLLALTVSGCASVGRASQPETTQEPVVDISTPPQSGTGGEASGGITGLVEDLEDYGVSVEPAGEIQQAFFSVEGKKLLVNGIEIQTFEYADEAARKLESDQISPGGSSIGTYMVSWIDQPNFWAAGRLIVLYVGQDAATIDLLSSVMGVPITTHE